MEKSKWVIGDDNSGIYLVVCEACATRWGSESEVCYEDFYGEVETESHPKCEAHECDAVFA